MSGQGDGVPGIRRWAGDEGAALERALLAELDEDDAMSAFAVIEKRCAPLAEVERLRAALAKADALIDAVTSWQSHLTLEGLTCEYRQARNAS